MVQALKWQVFGGFAERCSVCAAGAAHAFHSFLVVDGGMRRSVGSFVEHDKVIAYDFGGKLLIAFLVFPAAGSEPAFDIDKASFVKVFLCQFGETAPKDYGMPFRL